MALSCWPSTGSLLAIKSVFCEELPWCCSCRRKSRGSVLWGAGTAPADCGSRRSSPEKSFPNVALVPAFQLQWAAGGPLLGSPRHSTRLPASLWRWRGSNTPKESGCNDTSTLVKIHVSRTSSNVSLRFGCDDSFTEVRHEACSGGRAVLLSAAPGRGCNVPNHLTNNLHSLWSRPPRASAMQ
jgi:hypothetical protein